jgi:hypothetical protein
MLATTYGKLLCFPSVNFTTQERICAKGMVTKAARLSLVDFYRRRMKQTSFPLSHQDMPQINFCMVHSSMHAHI